jgi:hypothetical protein
VVRRARSALRGDTAHHSRPRNSFPFLRANVGILLRQGYKPLLSKYHNQFRSARRNLTKRFPHTNFTIIPCVIAIQATHVLMKGLAGLVKLDLHQQANQTYEAGSGLI